MPRETAKKTKTARKKRDDRPMEFDRGWHELEARHDRLKPDWASLAALIGGAERKGFAEES